MHQTDYDREYYVRRSVNCKDSGWKEDSKSIHSRQGGKFEPSWPLFAANVQALGIISVHPEKSSNANWKYFF